MITSSRSRVSASGGVILILAMLANPAGALAAGAWSPAAVISASQPTNTPNAFAFDPAGNEIWVSGQGVQGGAIVQVSQRSFGGAWSPPTTIWKVSTVGFSSVQSVSASLGANGAAAAAWLFGGGVGIAVRSTAGVWQAPVSFAQSGSASNLEAKVDAQGNGVASWALLTSTASIVEAVSWTAAGVFSNVVQLSPASQGAFGPDLAVNEAGTAVVAWEAAAPLNPSSPAQIESATRPAGGSWSPVAVATPVLPLAAAPRIALDGPGNATVVWQQATTLTDVRIYAATQPAGGSWGGSTQIEPLSWTAVGGDSVAADSAGNVTATWVVGNSGTFFVRTATRPAGGTWEAATSLAQCRSNGGSLCAVPPVAAARDGSITVVGFTAAGGLGNLSNVVVRLGQGQWVPMVISGNPQIAIVTAANNARASAVFPVANHIKYHNALDQSDYQ
jgi:hypothetical protein